MSDNFLMGLDSKESMIFLGTSNSLNRGKCTHIAMNGNDAMKIPAGLDTKESMMFLGTSNSAKTVRQTRTQSQDAVRYDYLVQARCVLENNLLQHKLRARGYDVIIKNKLLYGLETVRINAFQLISLRHIIKLSSRCMKRAHTNENLIRRDNEAINASRPQGHRETTFFEFVRKMSQTRRTHC